MDLKHLGLFLLADAAMGGDLPTRVCGLRPKPERQSPTTPKNCQTWQIGNYEVVALNRKNATRKAGKLYRKDVAELAALEQKGIELLESGYTDEVAAIDKRMKYLRNMTGVNVFAEAGKR